PRPLLPGGGGCGMSAPRSRRPWPTLTALAVGLLLGGPVRAQEGGPASARARFNVGTHAFRRCLFNIGYQPLTGFDQLGRDPRSSVLLVLGDPRPLLRLPGGLGGFLRKGGAVLLATDWETTGAVREQLVSVAGVRVTGEAIVQSKPDLCWGKKDYRPWL